MSCLNNLTKGSQHCCESNDFCCEIEIPQNHSDRFWESVEKSKTLKNDLILFNEKHIRLNDAHRSVVIIGLNPQNRFEVNVRIEANYVNNIIELNGATFLALLESIDEQFNENEHFPTQNYDKIFIQMYSIHEQLYKIFIGEKRIIIDQDILIAIREKKSSMNMYIKLLSFQREKYKSSFLTLITHFCSRKSVDVLLRILKNMNDAQFIEEISSCYCERIDKLLLLEITLNGMNWFSECVAIYCEIFLLKVE